MRYGIAVFPADYAADPATIARLVEERGFESLFFPEHTHIPAARQTPVPAGGELPRQYSRTYDPFVALTAAAAVTERILLATGICLVIERDPIVTAKEVASLDRLSGGRFLFGVGAGWNIEEMENHGTNPRRRFSLMRERIEAMKAIWTEDEAAYHGDQVDFDRIWCWPKPLQKPHPPVLVGGNGELAAYIVGDLGLLMVGEVRILNKRIITERHKRARATTPGPAAAGRTRIDLSHVVEDGMTTYRGLPAPLICDFLSREQSREHYAPGTEFQIGSIQMCSNTGTYLDSPLHRYAGGIDLSELPLERLAEIPAVTVGVTATGTALSGITCWSTYTTAAQLSSSDPCES